MCRWSVKILKKIEESKNDSVLYWSYYNQFRKYICDWNEQKVCCCGQEQTDPDQWGLSNEVSMINIVKQGILSSEQESKFLSSLFLTRYRAASGGPRSPFGFEEAFKEGNFSIFF